MSPPAHPTALPCAAISVSGTCPRGPVYAIPACQHFPDDGPQSQAHPHVGGVVHRSKSAGWMYRSRAGIYVDGGQPGCEIAPAKCANRPRYVRYRTDGALNGLLGHGLRSVPTSMGLSLSKTARRVPSTLVPLLSTRVQWHACANSKHNGVCRGKRLDRAHEGREYSISGGMQVRDLSGAATQIRQSREVANLSGSSYLAYKNRDDQRRAASRHYQSNKEDYKRRARIFSDAAISRNRAFIDNYLLNHECVDCGEQDPVVLDFDHVRGIKRNNICDMIRDSFSIASIRAEIAKCEVRCANCHRRATRARGLKVGPPKRKAVKPTQFDLVVDGGRP